MVARAGVDWIGLNFWSQSKRVVDKEKARAIVSALGQHCPNVKTVGLFVNHRADQIDALVDATGVQYVQLHGDESPEFARRYAERGLKAVAVADEAGLEGFGEFDCSFMLVDAASPERGGTGKLADWKFAALAAKRHGKTFLAGGLNAGNVAKAIGEVRPYGVDVASGVEVSPGVKDADKVAQFVAAVRGCQ